MKKFINAFAATVTLTTTTFLPIQANAGIETLEECYTAVINWCNETFPDHDCSQTSGLDDCDEVFGDHVGGLDINKIYYRPNRDGTYRLTFEPLPVPMTVLHNDNDDDDNDREPARRPSDEPRELGTAPARR